jgi:hypothetical protein
MGDFYIRQTEGGDVRGPFDDEQMTSLADAGKITLTTQVADETKSEWFVVGESEELKAFLFPERKKIGLKKGDEKAAFQQLNNPEDEGKPGITVEQMLAAAEGQTTDTKHLKDTQKKLDRAAGLSMPVLTVMMVLSGLANSLPRYPVIVDLFTGKFESLLHQPFALVGLFDFLLALGLFLNVFSLFPLVRFRAMLGLGFFLLTYWSLGDHAGMVASVCAGLGLFICTMTLNLTVMIVFALVGVGGMGYLAWAAWTAVSATAG